MANEIFKEIKTKIALKWLDYATWSTEAFKAEKPLKGEVWFCEVPDGNANAQTAPTVLFKVGDGVNTFGALKWSSALAADVYSWAKKSETDFIEWVNTVVEHPAAPVITTGNANGTIAVDGTDVAVKGLGDAAYTTVESLNATAKGYADAKDEAIAAAKKAGDDAQTSVNNLADFVGELPEDAQATTVVGYVENLADGVDMLFNGLEESGLNGLIATENTVGVLSKDLKETKDVVNVLLNGSEERGLNGLIATEAALASKANYLGSFDCPEYFIEAGLDNVTVGSMVNIRIVWGGGGLPHFHHFVAVEEYQEFELPYATVDPLGGAYGFRWIELTGGSKFHGIFGDEQEVRNYFSELIDNHQYPNEGDMVAISTSIDDFELWLACTEVGVETFDIEYFSNGTTWIRIYDKKQIAKIDTKADKSVVDAMYTNAQIDELVQGAKDYADTNDANTEYHVEYDSANKKIKLVAGTDASKMEIDATDFIKDGMIDTVTIGEDNDLVITFNTAAGKDEIRLPLDQLVDIYTGVAGDRVAVTVSSDKKISAELVAGSISKNYLDAAVQTSLGLADTALQSHQSLEHLATKEALEDVVDGTTPVAKATNADKLGGELPTYYATKASVDAIPGAIDDKIAAYNTSKNFGDIITHNAAEFASSTENGAKELAQGVKNVVDANKETWDKAGTALQAADLTAYDTSKNFGDIITHNAAEFATSEQGGKADTALQEITTTAGNGLKVTNKNNIDIDTDVVFVLDCNW